MRRRDHLTAQRIATSETPPVNLEPPRVRSDNVRTLLIDNHDSYTFNLFQLIAEVNQAEPVVIANDDPSLATLRLGAFDNIVISPGPGRPQVSRDVGLIPDLLRRTDLPVLGVCLGHQAIAHLAGAAVVAAPRPRHGHLTTVKHNGDELFAGIPAEFTAVRYHSLCVEDPLPEHLLAIARAEDGVVMALRQRDLPRWGVQFHPESIASEHGREILANFRELSLATRSGPDAVVAASLRSGPIPSRAALGQPADAAAGLALEVAELPEAVDAEAVYLELFAAAPDSFWLDSSRVEPGLSRFSFLGDASGPLGEVLTYDLATGAVQVRHADDLQVESGGIFDLLERGLRERHVANPGLPFDFNGGYVGYFGYEMRADCGAGGRHRAQTPDAAWIFADRLIAVDHEANRTYVLAVYDGEISARSTARAWVDETAKRLAELPAVPEPDLVGTAAADPTWLGSRLVRDEPGYLSDIQDCLQQLVLGESYEICLTNKLRLPFDDDDLEFYRRLRRANPAPYAALLRIGEVTVFSSSPERFLRIDGTGRVESRPIKGTVKRSTDPVRDAALAASLSAGAKTRAENLMIVDLLRNDLGRVCEIGSVRVENYMAVESYATVHQLVSTIAGRLNPSVCAIDCVRHCFPGGSMTGAPKQRTMEIIDRLETEARGVYSGALGYFGLAGGADLSIVIRTAVRLGNELSIGAGGAIVLDSDLAEEYDEMLLKAASPLRSLRTAELNTR
jgi:para-aminobenzoate synthetase